MVPVQVGEACSLAEAFEVFESAFDDYWIDFGSIQVKTLDCPSFDHRPGSIRHKTILTELETDGLSSCLKLRMKMLKIKRIFGDYKQEIYHKIKKKKRSYRQHLKTATDWLLNSHWISLRVCAPFSVCKSKSRQSFACSFNWKRIETKKEQYPDFILTKKPNFAKNEPLFFVFVSPSADCF